MSKSAYYNRTRMLNLFTEKKFSVHTRSEIAFLFKNISPENKEYVAKLLYPILRDSTTEKEAIEAATKAVGQMAAE